MPTTCSKRARQSVATTCPFSPTRSTSCWPIRSGWQSCRPTCNALPSRMLHRRLSIGCCCSRSADDVDDGNDFKRRAASPAAMTWHRSNFRGRRNFPELTLLLAAQPPATAAECQPGFHFYGLSGNGMRLECPLAERVLDALALQLRRANHMNVLHGSVFADDDAHR